MLPGRWFRGAEVFLKASHVPPPSEPEAPTGHDRPTGLRSGLLWTLGGQLVYSLAQWGMVSLLAHRGTPEDVGSYALGLALTAPLFLLLGMQLRGVQATDARKTYAFRHYFSLRLLTMAVGLLLTVLLAAFYPHSRFTILWLGVAKALEGISDVIYGLLQQRERLDVVARSTLWRGMLGLALLTGLFLWTGQVAIGAFGIALAGALTLLLYDIPQARRLEASPWWDARLPVALPRLAWPLGVVMGLISLGSTLPRLFIERTLGPGAVGVYSALAYLTVAGSVVIVALGNAVTTRLSQQFAAGEHRAFVRLTALMTLAAAAVAVGLNLAVWLFGEPLLWLLYGEQYADQTRLFSLLTLSGSVGYLASCAGFAVTAARRFSEQLPLFLVVTAVLALACALLTSPYGLAGAALATLAAAVVQFAGSWWIVFTALKRERT